MKKRGSLAVDVGCEYEDYVAPISAGGTLRLSDFHLNALGGLGDEAGIPLSQLQMKTELGRGGSSVVYLATFTPSSPKFQHLSNSHVAVKCVSAVEDEDISKQLLAELNFLRPKLRSQRSLHAVHFFDAYHEDHKTFIVMEFCERGSLAACIQKYGPPSEDVLSVVMRHIFHGLAFLHQHSIIHRDLKPSNCLINAKGIVKVSDFGCSRQAGSVGCVSTFTGTMLYMSPERLEGEAYSAAADIWSSGMIMLEASYGHHPYLLFGTESSFVDMLDYAKNRETPPLPNSCSDAARELVEACLAKHPAARPSAAKLVGGAGGMLLLDGLNSHPFLAANQHLSGDAIVEWSGGRCQYE